MPSSVRASDQDAMLSVAQAAALLGVHPNTLRGWTDAGRLTAYRINLRGDRRYRRGEVERLLAEGATTEAPGAHDAGEGNTSELATLIRLARGNSGSATPTTVCRTAVEALRTSLNIARVAIYLARDGGSGELTIETHAGYRVTPPASLIPADEPPPEEDPRPEQISDDPSSPIRAQLPLMAGGELLGILVLEDEPGGALGGTRPAFLATVASIIGTDIGHARVLARARREVSRARALRHVTQEMTGTLDLNTVLTDIVDRTRSLFDADKAGLWLLDETSEKPFHEAAARGLGDVFLRTVADLTLDSPAVGVRAAKERRTFVIRDAGARPNIGIMHPIYVNEGITTACLVPLVSNDRAVGVIGLYHTRDRDWPEDELTLAQSFANQAAVAISNASLYRSVADHAARMRSIQDLSARLNRLTDVRAISEAIVAEASSLAAYHDIRVYAVDWETNSCEPVAFTDRLLGDGDFLEALRVDIGEGSFTGWVAEHGEPILANDALNDPRGHTIEGTDDIEESMLVVPMLFEGRSVGVIALSKLGRDQFSTDDLQTMTIFAGYAAQAIANATAYAKLELQSAELARQLKSQRRLLEINERLLSTLDREIVLDTIADGLYSVVRFDNFSIYRADEQRTVLAPVLTRERHAEQVSRYNVPFGHGLMGWAVDHAEPVLANDALNDPRAMQIPGTPADPEALVVVPLSADGVVIGCMNISRVGGQEAHFSQADFDFVKLFAGQASLALRNAEEHQRVTVRADTDALTGLRNHGAFQRTLGELLGQAEGSGTAADADHAADTETPQALVMMDLDNFKAYNDRLGHPAGDRLLHAVGTAIYGTARTDDLVFRYGGDEFALILSGADTEVAVHVAERVAGAVAALTAHEQTTVTMSVGIAAYPGDATDKNELIALADTALYYGKQSGGNRIVPITEVPREMRDLRSTLDRLARVALQHPEDPGTVDSLVAAARRSAAQDEEGETTLDALLSVARSLDGRDAATAGHGDRVGRLARRVAAELQMPEEVQSSVELAARFHGFDALGSEELDAIPSLRDVSRILRAHRSTDGHEAMQQTAQIVDVANAYDALLTGADGTRLGRRAALERLRADCPDNVGPKVLAALGAVVGVAPRKDRRRRAKDAITEAEATA